MRIRMIWELRPWVGKGKSDTLSLLQTRSNRAMSHDFTVLGGGPNVATSQHLNQPHPRPKLLACEEFDLFGSGEGRLVKSRTRSGFAGGSNNQGWV